MTTSRVPTAVLEAGRARLCAWGPLACSVLAFVVAVLRAPGVGEGAVAGGAPPLWQLFTDVASLLPVGDLAFRLQLLSAASGALAALWTARLVIDVAVEPDAAAGWGGVAASGLVAVALALLDAATAIGPAALAIAALAGSARLLARVAAGAGAAAGLGLVIALGLGAAAGASFLGIVPVAGSLLVVRLYRGARFPLGAPVLAAVVVAGIQMIALVRGTPAPAPAPLDGRLTALLSLAGDSLGPVGAIAGAVGLVLLWRRRRTLWLAAALTAIAAFGAWHTLRTPFPDPTPPIWVACACAGFGVAALVRLTGRFGLAAGAGAALLTIAPAAALSLL